MLEYDLRFDERLARLKKHMEKDGLDLVILYNRGNVRYLTGWRQNTTSYSILFITRDDITYMVPDLDLKAAKKECWIDYENIYEIPEDPVKKFRELNKDSKIERVGVESETILHSRVKRIKQHLGKGISDIQPTMNDLRVIKTPEEQKILKDGGNILSKVMQKVFEEVHEAKTEKELTARAKHLMDFYGGETYSFEPFAMSGENSWLPHRTSTDKKLRKKELIVVDMGLIWHGYSTDMTRTFSVDSSLGTEQKDFFEAALEAHIAAKEMVKPGIKAEKIHERAIEVFEEYGYAEHFPHLTGHGVGCDIHEAPIIYEGGDIKLLPGMVVTIEPGIYKEGIGGARVEDMVLVTKKGHEVLTEMDRRLI